MRLSVLLSCPLALFKLVREGKWGIHSLTVFRGWEGFVFSVTGWKWVSHGFLIFQPCRGKLEVGASFCRTLGRHLLSLSAQPSFISLIHTAILSHRLFGKCRDGSTQQLLTF